MTISRSLIRLLRDLREWYGALVTVIVVVVPPNQVRLTATLMLGVFFCLYIAIRRLINQRRRDALRGLDDQTAMIAIDRPFIILERIRPADDVEACRELVAELQDLSHDARKHILLNRGPQ